MAVYTPRGLKIRLEPEWVFGLAARLNHVDKRETAFRTLKTVEAIELIPTLLALIAGGVTLLVQPSSPWVTAAALIVAVIVGKLLTSLGLFLIIQPLGLLQLARAFGYTSGFGVWLLVGHLAAWYVYGFEGVAAWACGLVGGLVAEQLIDALASRRYNRLVGVPLTGSEIALFSAYRLGADRLGITRDIQVSDSEAEPDYWEPCFNQLIQDWPELADRTIR